jgi:hypothetical protein
MYFPNAQPGGGSMSEVIERAAVWKRVTASILDFFTVFSACGYAIGHFTEQTTANGFNLKGTSAFMLLAIVVVYFFVGRRVAGGTLWDRIFRIKRPQPD